MVGLHSMPILNIAILSLKITSLEGNILHVQTGSDLQLTGAVQTIANDYCFMYAAEL